MLKMPFPMPPQKLRGCDIDVDHSLLLGNGKSGKVRQWSHSVCTILALTCQSHASIWRTHTTAILYPLLEAQIAGFGQALFAVS